MQIIMEIVNERWWKGSKQRPTDKKKFDENYDKIFGNKKGKEKK